MKSFSILNNKDILFKKGCVISLRRVKQLECLTQYCILLDYVLQYYTNTIIYLLLYDTKKNTYINYFHHQIQDIKLLVFCLLNVLALLNIIMCISLDCVKYMSHTALLHCYQHIIVCIVYSSCQLIDNHKNTTFH